MEEKEPLKFVIDLQKFFEICAKTPNKSQETFNQKEISESYERNDESNLVLQEKVVHEVITPNIDELNQDKFELMKMLLSVVLSEEESEMLKTSLSFRLAFNTFMENGVIK